MLFEAGLISVIRTLLIFVCIYYAFRLLVRFLFPFVLRRFVNKQTNNFNGNYQQNSRPVGEVHVDPKPKQRPNRDSLGDYVEYEEIE